MRQPVFIILLILQRCACLDLTYYVKEGMNPGTYLGNIAADSHILDTVAPQDRKLITFSLLQQGEQESPQLFRVSEKSGKLFTILRLDAERLCTYNTECYEMVDIAVRRAESFMRILEIKVIIQDVNDHTPEFPQKLINIEFYENAKKGTKKLIPNAVDRDVGLVNSQIDYQLKKLKTDPFSLFISKRIDGTSKLEINLEDDLDREVKDSYLVHVIAKDGGTPAKQSVLDVHISIIDINDNTPVFSQNVYNVTVKNRPSEASPIVILSSKDLDSGKYGKVKYQFSSKTPNSAKDHFKLNELTGEVFLHRKFSIGKKQTYNLYIEAVDDGKPPLSSIAMVQVNVINEQNNPPKIDVNFVSASKGKTAAISEDIKVGSFIAYVKVTDHDNGQNGEVSCDLHHDKFQLQKIDTKKYKIIVKKPIDREAQDNHDITISCQDDGSPPLHSETKFAVHVTDVNDVKPQFSERTVKLSIAENQKAKSQVGWINATDPDLGPGGRLTYSLLTSDKEQFFPFRISDNGLISTIMSLDHEFQKLYKFQVLVEDNGTPSLNNTVNVEIEVTDENDNAPYFTFPSVNPYSLDVVYYPHHSKNITVLKAADKDSLENAFLKYEILAGNKAKIFKLNRYTGILSFNREIKQQDTGSYDLQFVVKDSGIPVLSASTNLSLILSVSNVTSEYVFNSTKPQLSDRIHQYLLIVIVLVAVTLAVPITAGLSICCIRCNDRRKAARNAAAVRLSKKNFNQQRHLIVHPHLAAAWSDAPVVRAATPNRGKKNSALTMKLQKVTDAIYQVRTFILYYFQVKLLYFKYNETLLLLLKINHFFILFSFVI